MCIELRVKKTGKTPAAVGLEVKAAVASKQITVYVYCIDIKKNSRRGICGSEIRCLLFLLYTVFSIQI